MPENTADILAQIHSIPALILDQFDELSARVNSLFSEAELQQFTNVVLTGCGDSHMACVAAELAFEQLAGLPAQAYPAMTAARYKAPYAQSGTLACGISVSGTAARPREALLNYHYYHATTVAITGRSDSPLASDADHILDCTIPSFEPRPSVRSSVRSYAASMLMLWLLAIRMGEARNILSAEQARSLRDELRRSSENIDHTIVRCSSTARELADEYWHEQNFVFVADGPNSATAMFGAAKLIENTGHHAMAQDTEEWAHLQYLTIMDRTMPTILISPGYRGHERAAEVLAPMLRTGHPVLVIVPEDDNTVAPFATRSMLVAGSVSEIFTPLVYAIPCELFSAYLIDRTGTTPYRLPHDGDNHVFRDGSRTVDSHIVVPIMPTEGTRS